MSFLELLLIALSLAMDAFTVSVINGAINRGNKIKLAILFGVFFGTFQFLMPILGFLLGYTFMKYITAVQAYVAFILLVGVGINMIREAFSEKADDEAIKKISFKIVTMLAIATSIDAFAVGITFSNQGERILFNSFVIGIIAFLLSFVGTLLGSKLKKILPDRFSALGGVVLIMLGIKALAEHLFF